MIFSSKNLLVLTFIVASFVLIPGTILRAQQMTESPNKNLVTQITLQIAQLQQQLNVLLANQQGGPGLPVRLIIPAINVDAEIDSVGLTPGGAIGAPAGPFTTGWFEFGTRPGDLGSAVIDGHFGFWKIGVGSVFDSLNKLADGDRIYVEDDSGITFSFVVRQSKILDPAADAFDVLHSDDGKSHLNLITCEGTWLPAQKTFTNRLVIFADKE